MVAGIGKMRLHSVEDLVDQGRESRRVEGLIRQHRPELLKDAELAGLLKEYQERAERARMIQAIAPGKKLEFAEVDGRTPVLGWVYSKGDSPIHVNFDLLKHKDPLRAKRTTFHEFTHLLTPRDLKIDESCREQLAPLFRHLQLSEAAWKTGLDTPFIEGYVEGKTISHFGADEEVLYTNREVPFVNRLEELGQSILGISFRSLFFNWQVEEFREKLLSLAWILSQTAES